MALQEVTSNTLRRLRTSKRPSSPAWNVQCQRHASTDLQEIGANDVEASEFQSPTPASSKPFDPLTTAFRRNKQLPASRYQFRPPRYNRGPMHPHQPPKASDPASRAYIPGPFTLPRLEQTYNSTFAPDLMTLTYHHQPPGHEPHTKAERLRSWTGDNPYYKNRPLRGPRGGDVLRPVRKPITFRNIPKLQKITVHCMVKEAKDSGSAPLHVAGMVLQAITNVRAVAHATKKSVAGFGVRAGQYLSLTCTLEGEDMFHFLSKVVDVVMPKIKDFRGVKGSSGDESGNLAFGFQPGDVAVFPEVEVNYDMYPPKMIPGCHVIIHTSAKSDYDARLLLTAVGIPFYGKFRD